MSASWFVTRAPRASARTRLFCFPHAGASAAVYHRWAGRLPEDIELHAAELPGRATRIADRALTDFDSLLSAILPALLERAGPRFALYGHSMGALMAFELAVRLQRDGHAAPACVFVSGQNAPHIPITERLSEWSDEQLVAEISRLNGTSSDVLQNKAFLSHYLSIIRADLRVVESYRFRSNAPLTCPLVVFAGTEDPHLCEEGILAWTRHTSSQTIIRTRAGGHFTWWNDEARIIEEISEFLKKSGEER